MKKKKLRLKQWVKDALMIMAISGTLATLFIVGIYGYEREAKKCDEYYGRTCSIYEVGQFGKEVRY